MIVANQKNRPESRRLSAGNLRYFSPEHCYSRNLDLCLKVCEDLNMLASAHDFLCRLMVFLV